MSAVLKEVGKELTLLETIQNALGTYEEYSELIDSKNDKLYMCLKTLEAHAEETDQFTIEEVKEAKEAALIQVGAERKFCIQLANSPLPEDSVMAKKLIPDIESAINAFDL